MGSEQQLYTYVGKGGFFFCFFFYCFFYSMNRVIIGSERKQVLPIITLNSNY